MREMKDSGVEWIGVIPSHWTSVKLKRISRIQTGCTPSKTNGEEFYSDEQGTPWIKAEDLSGGIAIIKTKEYLTPKGISEGRLFPQNTVFVCCIASIGKTGFSNIPCSCNQQINGIIFNNVYWKYGYYMTLAQESEYLTNASGNVMKIINTEKQSNLMCPYPPMIEQHHIADYLDSKCTKIDAIIEREQAVIEKLKEYKLSVITEAVTKGLNPDEEMKDSGSEWLGMIPKNWDTRKLKYVFHIKKDIVGKEGYTVLSITQRGIIPKDLSKNEGQLAENYSKYQEVNIGDFAMNHMDLLTGWVDVSKYEGVTSPDYRVFVLEDTNLNYRQYFLYLMQTCYSNRIFYGLGAGVSGMGRWRLQADKFLNFLITVPPTNEQKQIAEYLNQKCDAIDYAIEHKQSAIEKLTEFKKSIIYEVVTGKREV